MSHIKLHFNSFFLFLIAIFAAGTPVAFSQQTATIKGRVINANHQGLVDVNLGLQGTSLGTASGKKGYFTIKNVPVGRYTFTVTAVGFKTARKSISLKNGQILRLTIHLSRSNNRLQQIVVEGESPKNRYAIEKSIYPAKIPLDRMENPQVVGNIPHSLMIDQMDYSEGQALNNVTGLEKMEPARGRSGDGGAFYNSRGFILQSKLRNGVAGNITSRIDAVNLEKIEVLKGPSATLYGSALTSYGGLINLVTKKPYNNFGGNITLAAGNYGFHRISADINTPLDSAKTTLLRVTTAYNYKGSFQKNGFDRYFTLNPSFTYKINDRMTLSLDASLDWRHNLNTTLFYPTISSVSNLGVNRADELPLDYRRSFSSADLVQDSRNSIYYGRLTYKISDHLTASTLVTANQSYSDGPNPQFYLLSNVGVTGNPANIGADYIARADEPTSNSTDNMLEIQQNINGDFNLGSLRNRFVAGLDYFRDNSNQHRIRVVFDTVASHGQIPNYNDFNKRAEDAAILKRGSSHKYEGIVYVKNTYSAYASDVLNITDNLLVMAALRVDHFVNNGSYDAAKGTTTGGYHQTALSPKFGLVYRLFGNHVSLFGNEQSGFNNENGANYQGEVFSPQHANQWEGGIKLNLFDGRLSGTLSYYNIKVEDVLRPDPDHPGFSIQNGAQRSKGVEATIITNPVHGLNITTGFSYNNSKYLAASPDLVGRRPVRAGAPWRAHWWISYRLPRVFLPGLGFGFGGNYTGESIIINSKSTGVFLLPAYIVLNAVVFYDFSKFRFSLSTDNLTNHRYWIGRSSIIPQPLRSINGSISFRF
jgi:iron complex outermembrane receptor protein